MLLPAAVHFALEDGNTTRAYELVLSWMYISRALKISGTNLVSGMVAVGIDGVWMGTLKELLETAPIPSLELAQKLFDQLDTAQAKKDSVEFLESEAAYGSAQCFLLADSQKEAPPTPSWDPKAFKIEAGKELKKYMDAIMHGRTFRPPRWQLVKTAIFGLTPHQFIGAATVHVRVLEAESESLNAPTVPDMQKSILATEYWIEKECVNNPAVAMMIPAFLRATLSIRGSLAQMQVLRALVAMKIAEMKAAPGAPIPTLKRAFADLKTSEPLEFLAKTPGQTLLFARDFIGGTYTIKHAGNSKGFDGEAPIEFTMQWSPGKNKN